MNINTFQMMWVGAGLLYPDVHVPAAVPLAQALIESKSFTSPVYQRTGNFFGMKSPQVRETTCTNPKAPGDVYAEFSSDWDCVRDFFLFLRARGWKDEATLLAKLDAGQYATAAGYGKAVRAKVAELKKADRFINPQLILGGGAVALAGVSAATVALVKQLLDGNQSQAPVSL